jgi:UDP-N-acetylmuramoylalanine--D-glutamate ligase
MKALVIGLGESGKGAACFLQKKGWKVVGVDRCPEKADLSDKEEINPFDFDLVVVSPGIPPSHPLCLRAREKDIEVIGEMELSFRHLKNLKNRCIGITGTNGKTTLTALIAYSLNACGIKARAIGNIGESVAKYLQDPDETEVLVIEISSFQLETLTTPILDIAIITNISPDHLDRYSSFEKYAETKYRIADCVKPGGIMIFPGKETKKEGYSKQFELTEAICKKFGISIRCFIEASDSFKKPVHRLEFVGEAKGVKFYNDSKATNPDATLFAVESLSGPILLLAGGIAKGCSFSAWRKPFKGRVKAIFAIGEAAPLLERELGRDFCLEIRGGLAEAFQAAWNASKKGDTILLSPGCASFDQFKNYEHRGEIFKELVRSVL